METQKGPWKVTGSEQKYENPWISVREDQVIRPDGQPGIFGVINFQPGASILAIDEREWVYLVREYKYAMERETIETVSGGCEADEDPYLAAGRELQEETGLTAEKLTLVGTIDPFTTVAKGTSHLFIAQGLTQGSSSPEGTESIEVLHVPLTQAVEWVWNGTITHSSSQALILRATEFLARQRS